MQNMRTITPSGVGICVTGVNGAHVQKRDAHEIIPFAKK
jgi:hypothetical protein